MERHGTPLTSCLPGFHDLLSGFKWMADTASSDWWVRSILLWYFYDYNILIVVWFFIMLHAYCQSAVQWVCGSSGFCKFSKISKFACVDHFLVTVLMQLLIVYTTLCIRTHCRATLGVNYGIHPGHWLVNFLFYPNIYTLIRMQKLSYLFVW